MLALRPILGAKELPWEAVDRGHRSRASSTAASLPSLRHSPINKLPSKGSANANLLKWAALKLFFAALFLAAPAAAFASPPRVEFDLSSVVACRDVTPPEFLETNRHERLMEATFVVSTLIGSGRESELSQLFFVFESPERTAQIVDYLPKTTLATPIVGPVGVEHKHEKSLNVNVGAGGPVPGFGTFNGSFAGGDKVQNNLQYKMLPPAELLAASGSLHREHGVFFKLKPSTRVSLEGSKQFVCVLRVPATWRADCIRVTCEARGVKRGVVRSMDAQIVCGSRSFLVGLYREGDEAARHNVLQLLSAEERLTQVLDEHETDLKKLHYPPSSKPHVGSVVPDAWLDALVHRSAPALLDPKDEQLPRDVRVALLSVAKARQSLKVGNGAEIARQP